jgi:hypothetical protein
MFAEPRMGSCLLSQFLSSQQGYAAQSGAILVFRSPGSTSGVTIFQLWEAYKDQRLPIERLRNDP